MGVPEEKIRWEYQDIGNAISRLRELGQTQAEISTKVLHMLHLDEAIEFVDAMDPEKGILAMLLEKQRMIDDV